MKGQYWYENVDSVPKLGRIIQMTATASSLVNHVLDLKPGEEVCIVTDTEVSPLISTVIAGAVKAAGGVPNIVLMEPLAVPSAEPPRSVGAAMNACDYLINCCSRSISHSRAAHEAYLEHRIKYVVMSNVTEDMMLRGASTADLDLVRDISLKVREALNQDTTVRVTTALGTDVTFDTTGRPFCGYYSKFEGAATVTVFPGGEVNTTPNEDSGQGRIVFDAFMMEMGLLDEPIIWTLDKGRIVKIDGGRQAREFERMIETRGDQYSRYIGELSVGTNYRARSIGSALEDKEVYGHVHIACGTGVSANDGSWRHRYQSTLHLDGIMTAPTVTVGNTTVVQDGEILVAPRPKG